MFVLFYYYYFNLLAVSIPEKKKKRLIGVMFLQYEVEACMQCPGKSESGGHGKWKGGRLMWRWLVHAACWNGLHTHHLLVWTLSGTALAGRSQTFSRTHACS